MPSRPRRLLAALAFALPLALAAAPVRAVQPDEMLADPKLEARARALSAELRCLVCQNQSIDDSDAPLARDLRLLVRERLTAGDTDAQVQNWLVARYGEFVLLRPRFELRTAVLWGLPFAVVLFGGIGIAVAQRRRGRSGAAVEAPLSADEKARLDTILAEKP